MIATQKVKEIERVLTVYDRYLEGYSSTSLATQSTMRVSIESRPKTANLMRTQLISSDSGRRSRQKTRTRCSRGSMI
jgi:hypothetical protein